MEKRNFVRLLDRGRYDPDVLDIVRRLLEAREEGWSDFRNRPRRDERDELVLWQAD